MIEQVIKIDEERANELMNSLERFAIEVTFSEASLIENLLYGRAVQFQNSPLAAEVVLYHHICSLIKRLEHRWRQELIKRYEHET